MKLKKSMLAFLLFFSLTPLCIFGMFSIYEMNQKIDAMLKNNLKAISENQIANIQKFANERKVSMELIAHYGMIQDAVLSSLDETAETDELIEREYLDDILKEQKSHTDYVASISIVNREFHVISSSEQYSFDEISKSKDVDNKFHTGDFVMGNVYERVTDDGLKRVVPAYVGIFDGETLIGYVVEELDVQYFNNLRLNMDTVSNGTFYLLDGEMSIITAGDNSQKESLNSFVTQGSQRSDFSNKWSKIDFEKNPKGEINYTYDGQEYITYYSNVENSEWSIRITENLSAQKKGVKSDSLLLILILVFTAFGTTVILTYVANRILNPIQEALEIFKEIENTQNYSLRMPVREKNEIGELMTGINELLVFMEDEDYHKQVKQEELKGKAESDSLTGLKNKKTIEKCVQDMLDTSAEEMSQITIGFLDIDDFRSFNTKYGHQVADRVICFVADTLKEHIKGEVGRIGGDEFLFCYEGEAEEETIRKDAENVLRKFEKAYIESESGQHIMVTCSLGIVVAKGKNLNYEELVRIADEAMYKAKNAGKNTVAIEKLYNV